MGQPSVAGGPEPPVLVGGPEEAGAGPSKVVRLAYADTITR